MPRHRELEEQLRRMEEAKHAIQKQLDELSDMISGSRELLEHEKHAPQDHAGG